MPPEQFLARPRRTLLLACAVLVLVVVWAFVVPDGTRTVDRRWWEWMEDTWSFAAGHAARFLAWTGNGYGRGLVVALVALPLLARRRWLGLVALAAVELVTPLTTALLKELSGQARPPDRLVHTTGSSFPSGHTSYAAATLVALVLLYTEPGPRRRLWWTLAALGTAAMGVEPHVPPRALAERRRRGLGVGLDAGAGGVRPGPARRG